MSLLTDAASVAKEALQALQTAADNILTGAEKELPEISGDALAFARDFIEQRAPASVKSYLHGLLDAVNAPAVEKLSGVVGGWLAVFKTDVDSAIGHLQNQISSGGTAAAAGNGSGVSTATDSLGEGAGARGPGGEVPRPQDATLPAGEPKESASTTTDARPASEGGGGAAPDGA